MNWILWQILAVFCISGYISVSKYFSQYGFYCGYASFVVAVASLGWAIPIAYSKTDFITAYMVQNGLLPIVGVVIGILFFGSVLTIKICIGTILITIGIMFFC